MSPFFRHFYVFIISFIDLCQHFIIRADDILTECIVYFYHFRFRAQICLACRIYIKTCSLKWTSVYCKFLEGSFSSRFVFAPIF